MDFSFIEIILIIITFFIGIIAVRVTFTFDINKHKEYKQKRLETKMKNYCPHMKFVKVWENYWVQSTFFSPSWTLAYQCQKCWTIQQVFDEQWEKQRSDYYLSNPKELEKQEKKFVKLLKKAWYI